MKCIKCKNKMVLDDTDYFNGNYGDYYLCFECEISCIEYTRNNKKTKIEWFIDEGLLN